MIYTKYILFSLLLVCPSVLAVPDFTRGGWNKVSKFRHAFVQ